MKKTWLTLLPSFLVLLVAGSAAAYSIDFTSGSFAGAAGLNSFTLGVLGGTNEVTISASGGVLSHNAGVGLDGFGVASSIAADEADEVASPETIQIGFKYPVFISSMLMTNLFIENNTFVECGTGDTQGEAIKSAIRIESGTSGIVRKNLFCGKTALIGNRKSFMISDNGTTYYIMCSTVA